MLSCVYECVCEWVCLCMYDCACGKACDFRVYEVYICLSV